MIGSREAAVTLALIATATVAIVARPTAGPRAPVLAPHSLAADGSAYADGAPPGFSGGFGEQSCHACHFEGEVNSGPERAAIAGVPAQFVAGERYALTITLSRPGMALAGFQLTARFKDDGGQAGTLDAGADQAARVKVEIQSDVQYANQHKEGTTITGGHTARWSVVWTAPDARRPVVFHVAANAGDGDGTAEGDHVETATVESRPAGPSARRSRSLALPAVGELGLDRLAALLAPPRLFGTHARGGPRRVSLE